jgi:hypothetical protein
MWLLASVSLVVEVMTAPLYPFSWSLQQITRPAGRNDGLYRRSVVVSTRVPSCNVKRVDLLSDSRPAGRNDGFHRRAVVVSTRVPSCNVKRVDLNA